MGFERVDEMIAGYEDEQLTAAWEAAKREGPGARLAFLSGFNHTEYIERRKAERRMAARRVPRRGSDRTAEASRPIGLRVADERWRARLRQEDLAHAVDMPRSTLAKIERGAKRLTFEEACRLADALGVALDRFRADVPRRY